VRGQYTLVANCVLHGRKMAWMAPIITTPTYCLCLHYSLVTVFVSVLILVKTPERSLVDDANVPLDIPPLLTIPQRHGIGGICNLCSMFIAGVALAEILGRNHGVDRDFELTLALSLHGQLLSLVNLVKVGICAEHPWFDRLVVLLTCLALTLRGILVCRACLS